MLFHRFEVPGLSHYSYAVGCEGAGRVAIVDPQRDVEGYVAFANEHDVRITHVLETHIHADYASGAPALAKLTGAEYCVSAYDRGEVFEVGTPHRELRDGDVIDLGKVRLLARHTPGHTPEHVSFVIYDRARSETVPLILLSGDFLFVGSLGRPDLLGDEAKDALARQLFRSVRSLADLPDGVEVCPAHGAGSMCGAGMSGLPTSTLGYERAANPFLDPTLDEDEFVHRILSTVPPFPDYYRRMKRVNSDGAPPVDGVVTPINVAEMRRLRDDGAVVVDTRDRYAVSAGHVPGAFVIELGERFATWASWTVPYDTPIILVADDDVAARAAKAGMQRVGLDEVVGALEGGMDAWRAAGHPVETTTIIDVDELRSRLDGPAPITVLDVRSDEEWNADHIDGATHIFCGDLPGQAAELKEPETPVAVICRTGYRSTLACSILQRAGWTNLLNVDGGMEAWWAKERDARSETREAGVDRPAATSGSN